MKHLCFFFILTLIAAMTLLSQDIDPFLWLEDVEGDKALEWVRAQNETSLPLLKQHPEFEAIFDRNKEIVNSKDKIAYITIRGEYAYNFWRDENHVRGIWRRTSLDDYSRENPTWDTVLDIDALADAENENWVYKGVEGLEPDYDRFLIKLSRGGADAVVVREFDMKTRGFLKDGFSLPEAKSNIAWIDENSVYVGTDFGPGSLTTSGYSYISKKWRRGTPLSSAQTVFKGDSTDVVAGAWPVRSDYLNIDLFYKIIRYYDNRTYLLKDGEFVQLDIPLDIFPSFFQDQLVLKLESDWTPDKTTYTSGSLISINFKNFMDGDRDFHIIDVPDDKSSIEGFAATKNVLILNKMVNVRGELWQYSFKDKTWLGEKVNAPDFGTLSIFASDDKSSTWFFEYESFNTPSSVYQTSDTSNTITKIKESPAWFDGDKFDVTQHYATSTDGALVPYFLVASKEMQFSGKNPTILYGYGGFKISQKPHYSGVLGTAWLDRGGVYALANIRGGGEFGPVWHQAALKEKRQQSFDDFNAIAEDLIKHNITSPPHLGIHGGSQGGLLVGVAFTQRPELYNAVACGVPLLDMQRYNKLLAGASWMGEYGDPDIPDNWAYIKKYSPYHNVYADKTYPHVFFYTSTRDDRVHPGHARKMVAKMKDMGHTVYYYENIEGGHGAAANMEQAAYNWALIYSYFWQYLK
jgi:prolyl oligopeptidase